MPATPAVALTPTAPRRIASIEGSGMAVRRGPHVALLGRAAGDATRQAVRELLERADDAGGDTVEVIRPVRGEHFAALLATRSGHVALLGSGAVVTADHVGYRSRHEGPFRALVRDATRLVIAVDGASADAASVLAAGASLGPGQWAGARSAGAVAVETRLALGRPGQPVQVRGCGCGAVFHPMTLRCPGCGATPARSGQARSAAPLPPAWLTLDDGRRWALAGSVRLGREPTVGPEATAEPLVLDDTERSVSRDHAEIEVRGWELWVHDRRAVNGTFVRPLGEDDGVLLTGGDTIRVLPGTALRLGRRWVRLDP